MKTSKLLSAVLLTASLSVATMVNAADFETFDVSASAGAANMYLWRGYDVGEGDPAVFGDISVSYAGFYGSVWTTSGDALAGQEYDLILGYGAEFGKFVVDIAAVSYVYPRHSDPQILARGTDIGDWVEAVLTVGYGPISFSWFDTLEAKEGSYAPGEDYSYFTASANFNAFGILIGRHDMEQGDDPVHLDLSYAYNDRLSFIVSKFIADEDAIEHDANFVVSYSFPLE